VPDDEDNDDITQAALLIQVEDYSTLRVLVE
jgi:hypothetical protein